jgi:hypothetical protein
LVPVFLVAKNTTAAEHINNAVIEMVDIVTNYLTVLTEDRYSVVSSGFVPVPSEKKTICV